jgi:hypothetical protein
MTHRGEKLSLGQVDFLQDKNWCLQVLHDIYPDADVGDLRFRINSKLKEDADLVEQVKGLMEQAQMGKRFKRGEAAGALRGWERFRSEGYTKAVENTLYEFQGSQRFTRRKLIADSRNA